MYQDLPCPEWARDEKPDWLEPYLGARGMPAPWCDWPGPIGKTTASIDHWQANNFIAYRPETADFLYGDYVEPPAVCPPAVFPGIYAAVSAAVAGLTDPREMLRVLLEQTVIDYTPHPTIAPLGPRVPMNRGLDDDALFASGAAWCNEQARVFVRCCQLLGMPARMIFLFYDDRQTGHTIAEVQVDGQWAMVDSTLAIFFTDDDGRLLSAAECHQPAVMDRYVGPAMAARVATLLAMSDEALVGGAYPDLPPGPARDAEIQTRALTIRHGLRETTIDNPKRRLWSFGVLNYPWPTLVAR